MPTSKLAWSSRCMKATVPESRYHSSSASCRIFAVHTFALLLHRSQGFRQPVEIAHPANMRVRGLHSGLSCSHRDSRSPAPQIHHGCMCQLACLRAGVIVKPRDPPRRSQRESRSVTRKRQRSARMRCSHCTLRESKASTSI